MRNSLAAIPVVLIATLAGAAPTAAPPVLAVDASAPQVRVHRGEMVGVTVRVSNATRQSQSFVLMTCSWPDAWQSDDGELAVVGPDCAANDSQPITLAPGETDTRTLPISIALQARIGTHAIRLGFAPAGAPVRWAAPVSLDVVEVRPGLALTAKAVARRQLAFAVRNLGKAPIAIADHVVLQRKVDGAWVDMTWIPAGGCGPATACTTIAPGDKLALPTWTGMTCMQCGCHANVPAPAGKYRLRAQSCDGTGDHVGPELVLPAFVR